ncbi:MAG TPA: hypothetical protein DCS82_07525 [Rhodospirillaceae bacterium]|nr:hypothetical protein [Rhodospirillaceae bacterium]HAT35549.1 hypothetical protein [Rhodospirillaceae bacterium]
MPCKNALAILLIVFLPWFAYANEPVSGTVRLSYDGYAGPFYVMSATVDLKFEDGRYRVATNSRTEGFAAWMFSWRSKVVSEGRRENGTLMPAQHQVESRLEDNDRRVRLRYENRRPVVEELVPVPDGTRRDTVPEDLYDRTVDPLTMTANVLLSMAQSGRCEGDYRVFDGRRRYNLAVNHGASAELEESGSSVFSGPAQGCLLKLERIAGFLKKKTKVGKPLLTPTLWIARPLEGSPPVPVKFEAKSSFGSLRIHLTRFQMGDDVIELEKD